MTDIANIRLSSQQISETKFNTAKDLVAWMGAMQAQDYEMSKWAIGSRLPHSTDKIIQTAIDKGEIIRTHLMRPTWHLASAEDVYWMLELTAPQINAAMKSRDRELGLTDSIYTKSNAIIEKALEKEKCLTRDELIVELEKAKIATNEYRSGHLMLRAELEGIVCSGPSKGKKQTYAILAERVPKTKKLTKEEALAKLAKKYFASHGPATLKDFIWWSGLSVVNAKNALEMVKSEFISETVDSETYWFSDSFSKIKEDRSSVYLLPAFDEYIISYKDRSASLSLENQKKGISSNGIFRPFIVINGRITGLWKRTFKGNKVIIEISFFEKHTKLNKSLIEKEVERFGRFLGKEREVKYYE